MKASSTSIPRWYWIVSIIACLWLFFGVVGWFMDPVIMSSSLDRFSDAQQEVFAARPMWLFVLYGVAVFSGFIGAIGLLMRKSWAINAFWISLVSAAVQFAFTFLLTGVIQKLGAAQAMTFPLIVLAIGAFLVWFSTNARRQGWIG